MKLSELKNALTHLTEVQFELPNGKNVPAHFHVTEIGGITKNFMDCGGTVRAEETISLQLWESVDYHHRLSPEKFLKIIDLSTEKLGLGDNEIEVEYQSSTISKYALTFRDGKLKLTTKKTACLASDACGINNIKEKLSLSNLQQKASECCTPESGCC